MCAFSHDTFVFDDGKSETQENLIKIVDFLKNESETNSKKIDKLEEQHRKDIKELKLVVTSLIKDVEDKDEKLSKHEHVEKELDDLKKQIEFLKQENKAKEMKLIKLEEDLKELKSNKETQVEKDPKDDILKDMEELKLVVTALIKDV